MPAQNPKDRFSNDVAQMRQHTAKLTKWRTRQILKSARTALGPKQPIEHPAKTVQTDAQADQALLGKQLSIFMLTPLVE